MFMRPIFTNHLVNHRESFYVMAVSDLKKKVSLLLAIVLLEGPLKRVDDLCRLSQDGRHIGTVILGCIGERKNTRFCSLILVLFFLGLGK